MFEIIIVIFGLIVFEVISSVDNAIVNAHVLKTLPEKFRKIFLVWGLLIAVFVVRGVLPFFIIWIANTDLSLAQVWNSAFANGGREIEKYLESSKPLLLLGGGMYLFLVFLAWLFLEKKRYAFFLEKFIHRNGLWFYFLASLFFTVIIYYSIKSHPPLAFACAIGTTAFFLTDGFKQNAEKKEDELIHSSNISSWSKILYLEVLDASFSIDGVIGAFAFTLSVPLILIGNGIGAFVVREITIRGIDRISKYAYLKNGAMYSIGVLGGIMILESFGRHFPFWLAPLNTVLILTIFLFLSYREMKVVENKAGGA